MFTCSFFCILVITEQKSDDDDEDDDDDDETRLTLITAKHLTAVGGNAPSF